MVQEACHNVTALGTHLSQNNVLVPSGDQSLLEYFRRPRIIRSGTFPLGNAALLEAINVDTINNVFGDAGWFPQASQRLKGALYARFSLVFTLQVTATPFHQGIYTLNWQYDTFDPNLACFNRGVYTPTCVQLPHVKLDFSVDTMVQLKVPFVAKQEVMPIVANTAPQSYYGLLCITGLAPIPAVTGITAPTYHLMVHLEDMQVFGVRPEDYATVTYQSGNAVAEELAATGVLSRPLHMISKAVQLAGPYIPVLSSFSDRAAWVLGKASKVASIFGYSKPTTTDSVRRIIRDVSVLEHHTDVPTSSVLVAPFASNKLSVDSVFGTDIDEMSVRYVASRPSLIFRGNLTTSVTTNTTIYTCPITPSTMWWRDRGVTTSGNFRAPRASPGAANNFLPSNLFWLSSFFRYWRGSITFRFYFAKTKFHSGRLLCAYAPGYANVPYTNPGGSQQFSVVSTSSGFPQPFGLSAMFDLKDSNVFEFTVPFFSSRNWESFDDAIGSLSLQVIEPLLAPNIVSDAITYLVEVHSDDFEVAEIVGPRYQAFPQSTSSFVVYESGSAPAPAGESTHIVPTKEDLTIGESVQSLKTLIMCPSYGPVYQIASETRVNKVLPPWYALSTADANTSVRNGEVRDWYSNSANVAAAYSFVRGGSEYHLQAYGAALDQLHVYTFSHPSRKAIYTSENTPLAPPFGPVVKYWTRGPFGWHVSFPFYSKLSKLSRWALGGYIWVLGLIAGAAYPDFSLLNEATYPADSIPILGVQNTSSVPVNLVLGKCGSDDAMCGLFIGAPPLYLQPAAGLTGNSQEFLSVQLLKYPP